MTESWTPGITYRPGDLRISKAGITYTPGDRVTLHIPPTWWDRVRMFFGFGRKSPATEAYECVGSHQSSEDE